MINQYPKVSHTFIRREILALERQGFEVQRIALRGWDAELADEEDRRERSRTRYVLREGLLPLLWSLLRSALTNPGRFLSALGLAIGMSRGGGRRWLYHLAYLAEACRIVPWLKIFGATHVHAHFSTNATEVAMLANTLGGPSYSFTVHGQAELHFGGIDEMVRRASFVVAISSFGRAQLYHRVPHDLWHKVKVVHCGLDRAFHAVEPVQPAAAPRMVCVGRLSPEKGQLQLIEAAHSLANQGVRFDLVLVGDGEMRAEVEKLALAYGLAHQVRVTGWVSSDQVREEILAAHGLVVPSFSEGLPVVIMEAMALRRPVIATYVGGIPELVRPRENGWLVPAGSVDELAAAIEECLLKSPDERKAMGDAGYLRVTERHSVDNEATKLASLFAAHA